MSIDQSLVSTNQSTATTAAGYLRPGMSSWPEDARAASRVLESADAVPATDRRSVARQRYRVAAMLSSLSMEFGERAIAVYTRDVTEKSLGFLCRRSLATGTRAVVRIPLPGGATLDVTCTVRRCRPVIHGDSNTGWYEGALIFSQPQSVFSPTAYTRGNAAEI